jgi:hypothetical protein
VQLGRDGSGTFGRVQRIIQARDTLLQQFSGGRKPGVECRVN